ncbi:Uncharacterized protein LI90_3640 [Carbonactinospora thermoautotrophica]|uniref:Uncharacterized protein n=1 Tax=Carbonactinospora thermoautotrophica TaxID=1469144 RepID=A0A132MXQ1_9ACTN|nr:Uncharacterized protein LI90_3640 [Carbonactinospora thermoautotrophica]
MTARVRDNLRLLVAYGAVSVAAVQACYFGAAARLPVSTALLLEYLAPVLVVGWVWLVRRNPPPVPAWRSGW